MIHARNLDFAFSEIMRNITYEAWFYQDETFLFKSIMFAGMNGVFTGFKQGYSISINTRKPSHRSNFLSVIGNIGALIINRPQVSRVVRETLIKC